jgi:F0F1-type ATP synthase gamma subunit
MQLTAIKKKIRKNLSILKISTSLKIMSITRLKQLKIQKECLEKHIHNIKSKILLEEKMFEQTSFFSWKKLTLGIWPSNNSTKALKTINNEIHILLFTDMSFCGNFNKKNLYTLKEMETEKKVIIIGVKGEKYLRDNFSFLGKLYDKNILENSYRNIIEITTNTTSKIILHSYMEEVVTMTFSQNSDNLRNNFYERGYLKYWIAKHLVDFKHEECRKRLMKVTTAITNSEILRDILKIKYNKTRQALITQDLLEVISGSQMEQEE